MGVCTKERKGVTAEVLMATVKMESHPAWVKRLRMASIWTKSGQETSIERKEGEFIHEESCLPAKTKR